MPKPEQEICSINIMFPVESDEQAIDCKKKVKAALENIPEVQTRFMIMPMMSKPIAGG